jgi:hypothetical protein
MSRGLVVGIVAGLVLVAVATLLSISLLEVPWLGPSSLPADRYALAALVVTYVTLLVTLAALVAAVLAAAYGYRQLKMLIAQQQELKHQMSGRWLVIGWDNAVDPTGDDVLSEGGLSDGLALSDGPFDETWRQSKDTLTLHHLDLTLKNVGPGTADDILLEMRFPPEIGRDFVDARFVGLPNGVLSEVETPDFGHNRLSFRLICSIPSMNPGSHQALSADLLMQSTFRKPPPSVNAVLVLRLSSIVRGIFEWHPSLLELALAWISKGKFGAHISEDQWPHGAGPQTFVVVARLGMRNARAVDHELRVRYPG